MAWVSNCVQRLHSCGFTLDGKKTKTVWASHIYSFWSSVIFQNWSSVWIKWWEHVVWGRAVVSYKKDIEMNVSGVEVVFVVRQHVHDEISLWWLARLQDIYLHASHIHALRVCVCVCRDKSARHFEAELVRDQITHWIVHWLGVCLFVFSYVTATLTNFRFKYH